MNTFQDYYVFLREYTNYSKSICDIIANFLPPCLDVPYWYVSGKFINQNKSNGKIINIAIPQREEQILFVNQFLSEFYYETNKRILLLSNQEDSFLIHHHDFYSFEHVSFQNINVKTITTMVLDHPSKEFLCLFKQLWYHFLNSHIYIIILGDTIKHKLYFMYPYSNIRIIKNNKDLTILYKDILDKRLIKRIHQGDFYLVDYWMDSFYFLPKSYLSMSQNKNENK